MSLSQVVTICSLQALGWLEFNFLLSFWISMPDYNYPLQKNLFLAEWEACTTMRSATIRRPNQVTWGSFISLLVTMGSDPALDRLKGKGVGRVMSTWWKPVLSMRHHWQVLRPGGWSGASALFSHLFKCAERGLFASRAHDGWG